MNRISKTSTLTLCSLVALAGLGNQASAQTVILSDSFERTSGFPDLPALGGESNWGDNDNVFNGGTVTQTYLVTAQNDSNGQQQHVNTDIYDFDNNVIVSGPEGFGHIRQGAALVDFDLTTVSPNGYRVNVEMRRGLFGGYAGLAFGMTPAKFQSDFDNGTALVPFTRGSTRVVEDPNTEFSFLMRPIAEDAVSGQTQFVNAGLVESDNPFLMPNNFDPFDIVMDVVPQVAGSWGLGALVDVTITADNNPALTYSTTVTSDGEGLGYVTFTGNNINIGFDDLVIESLPAGSLVGDLDGDGFVGIDDLNIVLGNWNQNVPPANPLADPSGDSFVGIDDLNEVLGNWNAGTPAPPSAAVPEPASLALMGFGAVAALRRKR